MDYATLLEYLEQGLEKIIPEGTKKAYSVKELLAGVHFEDQSEGARMLTLAGGEQKEEGLRWLIKKMNRYVGSKLKLFGLTINYQNIAEDILPKQTGQQGGV